MVCFLLFLCSPSVYYRALPLPLDTFNLQMGRGGQSIGAGGGIGGVVEPPIAQQPPPPQLKPEPHNAIDKTETGGNKVFPPSPLKSNSPGLWERMATLINDILHIPILEDLAWYAIWGTNLLLAPLCLLSLPLLFVHDVFTGNIGRGAVHTPENKPVLITGCDTGFGHDTALILSRQGWKVYAGCLTDAGMASLSHKADGSNLLIPVKMVSVRDRDVEDID